MPSFEYTVRVGTTRPTSAREQIFTLKARTAYVWAELVRLVAGAPVDWTHEAAIDFVRVRGGDAPAGTRFEIERRRGLRAAWLLHRSYEVGTDGIVRRSKAVS